ncbi:uncharacterized protein J8A68_002978 [[Candida] subhashii]|uniref:Securin n=1 Tax=[Candida] subhashii TaxID=561895 RepID=A0A8J5QK96_9ASCO|nr:uncharacterized protein J8A68_002978 [[Candida] subhashii]KAG7663519.1 hypothetical protein J8A68_002978 [[Candida] subhashii]
MSGRIINQIDQENNANHINRTKPKQSNENINIRTKDSNRPSSSSASRITRIPLGGKNTNNLLTLNRSKSSLVNKISIPLRQTTTNIKPPALTKSNSTLGFAPTKPTVLLDDPQQQQQRQRQQLVQLQQQQQQQNELTDVSSKRPILDSLNEDLSYSRVKRLKGDQFSNFTDSLPKQDTEPQQPIEALPSTFTNTTDQLHESNLVEPDDINKYNVDPIKKSLHTRRHLEAQFDQEIEFAPNVREPPILHEPIEPLSESDLLFFSTPKTTSSNFYEYPDIIEGERILNASVPDLSLELDLDDGMIMEPETKSNEEDIAYAVSILENEELGLSKDELNDLLD